MSQKLFSEFPPVSTSQWEEVITKDLKGADYEKKLVWKTQEGISVRPYYRAEDLKNIKHLDTLPGEFPYVRGTKAGNNWLIRQGYCAWESYSKANGEALEGLSRGVESVAFCIDGNKAISQEDMAILINGIDLKRTEVNFEGCECATPEIISAFLACVKQSGVKESEVKASFDFDPLRTLVKKGNFCCDGYLNTLKECIALVKDYPGIKVVNVEAYALSDAGATLVQELGFAMSMGSDYIAILTGAGLSADEAASRIKFTFAISPNYFMEIAKFRAARVLWANIAGTYGAKSESVLEIMIHAVTNQWNMTVYDAYVNMLRGTTEAMSAALAGVDSIEVLPFDYPFREPGEFSNRVARNVQIILKEESYFDKVADPAAGSYYVETLTASFIENGWNLFRETEARGGFSEAFKAGFVQGMINESAQKRDKNIATRRETLLGTNQYPNFSEIAGAEITEDVVTREKAVKAEGAIAEPLVKYRGAQAFEALRFATDRSGKRPKVFMLTFGNLAMCRARAQFSSNFFAVAGYEVIDNNRFATVEEGVNAAFAAKADIVVACSSDEEYAEAVPQISALLNGKAILVVAGDPACKDDLTAKGIDKFINVKSNVLETLTSYQKMLGIQK